MNMKKILALILVVAVIASLAVAFVACSGNADGGDVTLEPMNNIDNVDVDKTGGVKKESIKIGLITLHDDSSTYDKNFIDAFNAVCSELGVSGTVVSNIDESNDCYDKAVEFAEAGYDIVFADSFGHESYLAKAAKEYPNVQFCHATGTTGRTANLSNFHTAFASIYEGRYLAGIAAGMKLKELYGDANGNVSNENAKMGYVGAFPYAEVVSGYSSFFLGAKSVLSNVTMEVTFTNSWYDPTAEGEGASLLITRGAKLISQHADSMGAPSACELAGVPNVTYNVSTKAACPNTYLAGCKINWATYFKYIIECVKYGQAIADDWVGGFKTNAVETLELGNNVAAGTAEAIAAAKAQFVAGTLNVYDCAKFTVNGAALTEYNADVITDSAFTPDTNVIMTKGGVTIFAESTYRSAPYFDVNIDGITKLQ